MELSKGAGGDECSVCVAVNIRPLVPSELEQGCRACLNVSPGVPVVRSGHHTFTYDHVFGSDGTDPDLLYPKCVAPLVEGLFKGYNATVFAYGQTGSGKTFTMGSEYRPGGKASGVIPKAIKAIFDCIETNKEYECSVHVSFVEIHKEEIRDLLVVNPGRRSAISIRESTAGGVSLYGAAEKEVKSVDEMANILESGSLARSTASTNMNSKSSRSHAIYTITVEQRRQVAAAPANAGDDDEDGEEDAAALGEDTLDDYLCAKLHLVDLAGSERAKRTKAEKDRLKEGIHINRGLLALGNVISALVDKKTHVPYRDSKLTRLLQDSLGGNSRTVMIACISPADINLEEGLNTLRYADRARHIRNKPTVNRDPVTAQVAALRQQVARLEAENKALRSSAAANGKDPLADVPEERGWQMVEELQAAVEQLQQDYRALEMKNTKLKVQLVQSHKALQQLKGSMAAAEGAPPSALSTPVSQRPSAANTPLPACDENGLQRSTLGDIDAQEPPATPLSAQPPSQHQPDGEEEADNVDDQCFYAEMAAHSLEQEKMKQDMAVLQKMLEQKERKMEELMHKGQVPALKQHYDRVLQELEKERDNLQNEKVAMMQKLQLLHAASEEERKRLESYYKDRIAQYDERLREVRRKEREFMTMQKLKLRTEEMCNRLNADISRIKQQKVQLMKTMDASARQFAAWKANREKEVLQLRRQNRRNVVHIQHLEALQAKQNAVLQRKISDATAARKKLKELQAVGSNRDAGRSVTGSSLTSLPSGGSSGAVVEVQPNAQAPLLRNERSRKDWLEKELDMCNQSFEYQRVLDGELAQRAETSKQLREIEKRLMVLEHLVPPSPLVVDGAPAVVTHDSKDRLLQRKEALVKQLADHNAQIIDLQAAWEQAKLEEEIKGGGAADAKRWTGIRNIIESRELLRSLFKVACDHKSQAKDVQMDLIKSQEELDLIRVQLDAARKEAEAQRKRAAAIEATAATAMTTPFAAESAVHDDDMDAEVDDLLHQLQVVALTPNRQLNASTAQSLNPISLDITRLHEAAGLDGTIQVQIQGPPVTSNQGKAADRYSAGLDESLDVAAQEDGASVLIGSDSDMDMDEAPTSRKEPADIAVEIDDESEEEEEAGDDDQGDQDDQDEDEAWDPSKATPARRRRKQAFRRASQEPEPQGHAGQLRRHSSNLLPLSSERAILEHVNQQLQQQGAAAVDRLTVKVLKDALTGAVVDGKPWRQGTKNKEQLLQDYCVLLDLPTGSSEQRQQAPATSSPSHWGSGVSLKAINTRSPGQRGSAVAAAVQMLQSQSSGQLHGAGLGLGPGASPSRRPPMSPQAPSPMAISPAPWGVSPQHSASSQQPTPSSPSVSWVVEQAGATLAGSPSGVKLTRAASLGHSAQMSALRTSSMCSPRLGYGGLGTPMEIPDSPFSELSLADPPRECVMTPQSLYFIKQAQEARARTAQLRQSIQKGAAGYEAAAAARAAALQDGGSPSLSTASAAAPALSSANQSPRPSPRQSPSPRAVCVPQAPTSSTSPRIWR